mgnify:FL=1
MKHGLQNVLTYKEEGYHRANVVVPQGLHILIEIPLYLYLMFI